MIWLNNEIKEDSVAIAVDSPAAQWGMSIFSTLRIERTDRESFSIFFLDQHLERLAKTHVDLFSTSWKYLKDDILSGVKNLIKQKTFDETSVFRLKISIGLIDSETDSDEVSTWILLNSSTPSFTLEPIQVDLKGPTLDGLSRLYKFSAYQEAVLRDLRKDHRKDCVVLNKDHLISEALKGNLAYLDLEKNTFVYSADEAPSLPGITVDRFCVFLKQKDINLEIASRPGLDPKSFSENPALYFNSIRLACPVASSIKSDFALELCRDFYTWSKTQAFKIDI